MKTAEKKYYPYSVKKILEDKYGAEDTVFNMRAAIDKTYKEEDRKDIIALCWKHADEEVCRLFIETEFLLDTIIDDDCPDDLTICFTGDEHGILVDDQY